MGLEIKSYEHTFAIYKSPYIKQIMDDTGTFIKGVSEKKPNTYEVYIFGDSI